MGFVCWTLCDLLWLDWRVVNLVVFGCLLKDWWLLLIGTLWFVYLLVCVLRNSFALGCFYLLLFNWFCFCYYIWVVFWPVCFRLWFVVCAVVIVCVFIMLVSCLCWLVYWLVSICCSLVGWVFFVCCLMGYLFWILLCLCLIVHWLFYLVVCLLKFGLLFVFDFVFVLIGWTYI